MQRKIYYKRVLIVEDDLLLARRIQALLRANLRCYTDIAQSLYVARHSLEERPYEMVILDRMLADGDSLETLEQGDFCLEKSSFLIISGCSARAERERGLIAGAFDYLSKPFSAVELIEKAKRLLMANHGLSEQVIKLEREALLYPQERSLVIDGRCQRLSAIDCRILQYLYENHNNLVSREELCHLLNSSSRQTDADALNSRIYRLRRKLGRCGKLLLTHYNVGYQLVITSNTMTDTNII